jgi:anti-anti-sigma regulatory factor
MLLTTRCLHPERRTGVVEAQGSLGRGAGTRLRLALLAAVEGHRLVIADLTAAVELGPEVVGVLAEAAAAARLAGRSFAVVATGETAAALIAAGMAEALGLASTVEEARTAMGAER